MSFGKHCRTLAAKARQTAAGIKSLANTVRGAKALLLQNATVVLTSVYAECLICWPLQLTNQSLSLPPTLLLHEHIDDRVRDYDYAASILRL